MLIFIMMLAAALIVSCGSPSAGVSSQTAGSDSRFAVGTAPGSLEIADLNGDSLPGIFVANEQSNNVRILVNNAKGEFTLGKGALFPDGHLPNDVAVGDFYRDAKPDLALANHDQK